MIDDLALPVGESLRAKPKVLPADVFHEWLVTNVRHIQAKGRLEQIRHSPQRRPVEVPFTL